MFHLKHDYSSTAEVISAMPMINGWLGKKEKKTNAHFKTINEMYVSASSKKTNTQRGSKKKKV